MAKSSPSVYNLSASIRLNNGVEMPRIHLGVYMTSGSTTSSMVANALAVGYRGFDSAEWYGNEAEVGGAINTFLAAQKELRRGDLWFTTKLKDNVSYEVTRRKIRESVEKSGLGYVDLYLLHSPYGGRRKRLECWRAVADAVKEGEVRAGGVSNYGVKHLQELLDSRPSILPAVNQIEVHPFNTRTDITKFCQENDIVVEAYAPLARAMRMKHPVILTMSKKYGCTPAQIFVRWSLQKGYVPLPKSVKKERMVENATVGKFEITKEDMSALDSLDEYLVTDWDPTDAD